VLGCRECRSSGLLLTMKDLGVSSEDAVLDLVDDLKQSRQGEKEENGEGRESAYLGHAYTAERRLANGQLW
jgi:hypothetical protein